MARKCKTCKTKYEPTNSFQTWCSIDCAVIQAREAQEKAKRKALAKARKHEKIEKQRHRAAKERLKSRSEHLKEAQAAFNKFIRLRDEKEPCISCGRHHTGQYHAGHYRSVGAAPELRFVEANVWKQCAPCNNHLSGNAIEYRINLVKRIGLDEVERLEGPTKPKKYTIEEIKEIKAKYRKKARELEKELEDL